MRPGFNVSARAIRRILWEDWDPIGCGVPEDEYDDYVWPVYRLLYDGADRAAIREYLLRTATETIGCPPITPHTKMGLETAADKLMAVTIDRGGERP